MSDQLMPILPGGVEEEYHQRGQPFVPPITPPASVSTHWIPFSVNFFNAVYSPISVGRIISKLSFDVFPNVDTATRRLLEPSFCVRIDNASIYTCSNEARSLRVCFRAIESGKEDPAVISIQQGFGIPSNPGRVGWSWSAVHSQIPLCWETDRRMAIIDPPNDKVFFRVCGWYNTSQTPTVL
jgi:hypothetical protein